MEIKSISNRKLKLLRKLNQKKYRQKEQLFLAEGERAVAQIIQNKQLRVKELFFDEQQAIWDRKDWKPISAGVDSSSISKKDFADVSDTDNPQGVIALCHVPGEADLSELARQTEVIVALDAIQDPGNMGTIIRTASWFGAAGFLSGKGTVDLFHPKVVRATAGATGTIPHANVNLPESLPVFEQQGWQILLLDAGGDSVPLKKVTQSDKTIIVIGNEANGIDSSLFIPDREKVQIEPGKASGVESLNAAVSVSIALYALC